MTIISLNCTKQFVVMETKGTEFFFYHYLNFVCHIIQGYVRYTSDRTHVSFLILFNVFRLNLFRGVQQ